MSLNIKPITDKPTWEQVVKTFPEANFLSSWNWGAFHASLGKQVFYLGIYQDNQPQGLALLVKETAKRGNYLTIAGSPLLDWSQPKIFTTLTQALTDLSRREHCLFVRVRPQILDTKENSDLFLHQGFRPSPMHLTADRTLQLNLKPSPQEILAQMRKNTRYEINKAERLGLTVKTSTDPKDIKEFHRHQLILAQKHGFVPFSYDFLHHQFQIFARDHQALLFHSYYQNTLLASAFIIFYGPEAVYHYGISTRDNQKLPGSYAALWAAIQEAKNRNLDRFNFWGIAPEGHIHHRFWGVTVFKKGFGGEEVAYLPAHDLPTSPLYPLTRAFESFRAKKRNLAS